ncbi:MAG: gamma-glutamyltransferase [Alphaproteobacteria bacterium]|jgi:gamma-glutamyltranspeptidase/glutathione hydrolase|nr:gamma-glutamyltransferase [Alphaproteobacteria bacterium]MDP7462438.1 gamma-glutamyltransferase [Alphaproteobacteria bacterium]
MTHGMVSAPQPEAVEAGLDILQAGGNVVDAAVGAALVQTAVDPQMCGIAGFGSMHLYLADRDVHTCIDFHGRAPLATRPDMWEDLIVRECDDGFGFVLKGEVNELGYQSMTTPLTIKAFDEALSRFGSRSLAEMLAPAIAYCEDGFAVRPGVHGFWTRGAEAGRIARIRGLTDDPATAKIYTKADGSIRGVGEILRNPDMARTYRRIAEHGVADFYGGGIAKQIDADMRANGGLITLEDLASCETETIDPLWTDYRGYRVATNQPPGGGLMIILMLNILENFDLAAMGHNSADYIATVSEAMKIATVDKDARMGDPRFFDIPFDELMSKDYARAMAERIKRGEKTPVPRMNPGGNDSKETTHICVADRSGNCVTMTHSLGSSSGTVTDGLGFMYNNCMMVFDPRPGHAGSLAPGKARFSALSPTIVFRDNKPFFLVGSPGGTTITMGNLQAILNAVDFNMTAQEAVMAPRFTVTSDTIEVTNRILRSTERELQARGYPTQRHAFSHMIPIVQGIRIVDSRLDGGSDPAGDGMAAQV